MHDIWEDPGFLYIWGNEAHQYLVSLGIENTADLVEEASARYEREWRANKVLAPKRLAKTIIHNIGISAMRHNSLPFAGARRAIIQTPIERRDPDTGKARFVADEELRLQSLAADEASDLLHQRLHLEREHKTRVSLMELMAEQLRRRMQGPEPVTCGLHEHGCPRPDRVLAVSLEMVNAILNDLDEERSWAHEQSRTLKPYRKRQLQDWEQRLHKRLRDLALDKAQIVDPALYGGSSGPGRQARSRVARCVLYSLWFEAQSAKFEFFARQAAVAVGWSYLRYLSRRGVPQTIQQRLHAWLRTYQPDQHDALDCTPNACPAIVEDTTFRLEGDLR